MKHNYTDSNGINYSFDFDVEGPGYVEIKIYREPPDQERVKSETIREIVNLKVQWQLDDSMYLSPEAKQYCDRLARLPAFH